MRLHKGGANMIAVVVSTVVAGVIFATLLWWMATKMFNGLDALWPTYGLAAAIFGGMLITIFAKLVVHANVFNWLKKYEIGGS